MSERDDFLDRVGTRLKEAEIALHNGDASPRFAIWSTNEPLTLLGAWMPATEASIDGEPGKYTLRATQVYRRENGEWKVVHRHADPVPEGA